MKRRRITVASIGILVLVIFAFGVMMTVKRAEDQLDARALEIERIRSLSHELAASCYELVSLSDNLETGLARWDEQVNALDAEIKRLREDAGTSSALQMHLARLDNLWAVRRELLGRYREALRRLLENAPELDQSNPGLLGLYQKSLIDPSVPASLVADLGFVASNVNRLEFTARGFEDEVTHTLDTVTTRIARFQQVSNIVTAFILVAVVAGTALILIRINRLHRSVIADNAARRRAEQAARKSERDLLITLQSIGEAVLVIDAHGRISRMNQAAERLVGWSAKDAVGKPADTILVIDPSEQRSNPGRTLTEILARAPISAAGPDLALKRRDGAIRRVIGSSAPMRSGDGAEAGAVLALRDVTERHRLEERLRQTQKLESIGHLAGGIAHDFNNLLQVVLGNIAMLNGANNLSAEQREIVREVRHAGRRAAELTDQLLAFSRRQTLTVRSEDLTTLVERSLRMVRRLCPPQIEIDFDDHGHVLHVLADAGQLEQVLINLVLNARDAMPDGGLISITISEVEIGLVREDETNERAGRFACLRVIDTGVGMDEEVQKRVFEPFFTTKEVGEGSGLGLSMVHGIIQQHGGFIQIESEPGKGTTVAVHIPMDPDKDAILRKPARPSRRASPPMPKLKILVAEDDPSVRALIERLLLKAGHDLLLAADGREACDLIDLESNGIDLIFTDIVMPQTDGVTVAWHARERYPSIPVIFCTGHPESLRNKKLVEQPWALLRKPWSVAEFQATVHQALHKTGKIAPV